MVFCETAHSTFSYKYIEQKSVVQKYYYVSSNLQVKNETKENNRKKSDKMFTV